ncbi:Mid2 domain-containing protein [Madurella fahalii]|uniref:Mid2 domain-containing protein n=1 Tax=Madurella fahalii TaxID=1157608 RepID=A0ABQ0GP85_9PEZI
MRADLFGRLPRPTALLLLTSVFELSSAHVLHAFARQTQAPTTTIPYHALNVVSWPLLPTPPPVDLFALGRRQENTICGYINGDSAIPATCSAGSHCALDTENNVVGCCPDGEAACTAGVFTGCVDANSGPQTEVNPYVFSCLGSDVCYKNIFDGGFSQFGCGTASDLAATVVATASGITLTRPTVTVSYSQGISTLSEPTTLGTITNTRTSTSSTSSRTPSSSASSSTDRTNSAGTSSPSPTVVPATASRTGAIVGGTIGGLAVLIALIALAFFFLRRRNSNVRQGPGPGGIRTKNISPPEGGIGTGFVALAQDSEAFETGPGPTYHPHPNPNPMTMAMAMNRGGAAPAATGINALPPLATIPLPPMPFQNDTSPGDDQQISPYTYGGAISAGAATSHSSYPPTTAGSSDGGGFGGGSGSGYLYPGPQQQYPAAYVGGGMRQFESDQVPLTREIDDFSQGFSAALGRIGEEDEEDEEGVGSIVAPTTTATTAAAAAAAAAAGGDLTDSHQSVGSERPLWQQNRRQSRNLMWM